MIKDRSYKFALVIGNGVNRYNSIDTNNSWDSMLLSLWGKHVSSSSMTIPQGISLTEFYDALDLNSKSEAKDLQKEFCNLMADWQPGLHHQAITDWARKKRTPILTTNFEDTLPATQSLSTKHADSKKFTDFYPWGTYYSENEVHNPSTEFAIWFINGMQKYKRSIRLGLSHYMGSVERARGMFHKGSETRLFSGKNVNEWRGYQTWLHVIFNNDLIFMGLELNTTEVFLRWLLIERAKYFRKFPERSKSAFFVYSGDDVSKGQRLFLESVGFKLVKETTYDDIYQTPWV
mgnify:FL=1